MKPNPTIDTNFDSKGSQFYHKRSTILLLQKSMQLVKMYTFYAQSLGTNFRAACISTYSVVGFGFNHVISI